MTSHTHRSIQGAQRGAVLFVALVFLLLLTMLGLVATGTSILQEKMTGSMRNRQLGLMGSESGLRGAEAYLWNLAYNATTARPMPPCVGGGTAECSYTILAGKLDTKVQAFRTSKAWIDPSGDGARAYAGTVSGLTGGDETASLATQPRFLIEDLGPDVPPGAGRRGGSIQQEKAGVPGSHEFFRITSRSQGGNDTVVRAAESVFSATTPNTYTPPTP
jgi:type IV pilus assembly protein PilX